VAAADSCSEQAEVWTPLGRILGHVEPIYSLKYEHPLLKWVHTEIDRSFCVNSALQNTF